MSALYLETSALLNWLLGEEKADSVKDRIALSDSVATSTLTLMESKRALIRLRKAGKLKAAQTVRLEGLLEQVSAGWFLIEIIPEVRRRACEPFPVEPVRTLDAIHLASALELLKVYPDLFFLTFDERIMQNLQPLGLL